MRDPAAVLDYPVGIDVCVGDFDDAEFFVGEEGVIVFGDVLQGGLFPVDVDCITITC